MSNDYTHVIDLAKEVSIPPSGIVSRTLQNDESSKILVFGFAQGQELSAHTAPMPAILYFVSGEAELNLGGDKLAAGAGTLAHMPPRLEHSIHAKTEVVMLLILVKARG
jgi:quercetin dioxygenase-like cupin family protein